MAEQECKPQWCAATTLVLGCGNVLFGDDGFGPEVARHLNENYAIPDGALVVDAGTGVRKILFDLVLDSGLLSTVVIVDALDSGRTPGQLSLVPLDSLPAKKIDDFSMHQLPTSNLLRELHDLCSVEVHVLACQPAVIPQEVAAGLSPQVKRVVPQAADLIYRRFLSSD